MKKGFSGWVGWLFRGVVYGLFMIVILTFAYTYVSSNQAENLEKCKAEGGVTGNKKISPLERAKAVMACLQKESWFVENWLMRDTISLIQSLPNAPCKYVGVWESVQPHCRYTFIMRANGDYTATPIACKISVSTFNGAWGVYENKMVWLDNREFRWPPDINPIEEETNNFFVLLEGNGSRTKFTRLEQPSAATGCAKPAARNPEVASISEPVSPIIASPPVAASSVSAIEPAQPVAAEEVRIVESVSPETKPKPKPKPSRHIQRRPTDLRYCLERANNYEIAQCATENR